MSSVKMHQQHNIDKYHEYILSMAAPYRYIKFKVPMS